jgi:carbon-monoxide dehydrogenase medium subunit
MFPRPFDYFAPTSLTEALGLLQNADSKVKVLAGGQSLIPALKTRNSPLISSLKSVVDITGMKELNYIRKEGQKVKIGALTTVSTLENDREIASSLPILQDAVSEIADPLVRNLGTVGGNLCHADPVNDLPATMVALNASVALASMSGNRKVNVEALYVGPYETIVKPEEILTEVEIPLETARCGNAYRKVKKGSGGFTIAGVAANLSVEDDNTVYACRIALTGVGPKTLRPQKAEQTLVGKKLEPPVLDDVAKLAVEASQPVSDLYASEGYRRKVLGVLVEDALEASYKRAVMGGYEKS